MDLPDMRAGQETGEKTSPTFVAPRAPAGGCAPPAGASVDRGRPSKYDPSFCELMIGHCAAGKSLTSFAASISVARRTLLHWAQGHEDFADALDIAKAAACAWWEERARKVGDGDGGPGAAAMVQFMLKNFGTDDFSDRRQVEYSGGISHNLLTYEQAVEEARLRGLPERVLIADHSGEEQ